MFIFPTTTGIIFNLYVEGVGLRLKKIVSGLWMKERNVKVYFNDRFLGYLSPYFLFRGLYNLEWDDNEYEL